MATRYYLYGDDAVWRITKKTLKRASQGLIDPDEMLLESRMKFLEKIDDPEGITRYKKSSLPEGVYQTSDESPTLDSFYNDVQIESLYDADYLLSLYENRESFK